MVQIPQRQNRRRTYGTRANSRLWNRGSSTQGHTRQLLSPPVPSFQLSDNKPRMQQTGHVLFEIPRNLLLSTRTSELKKRLGKDEWASLGKGWTPLILCMMWEAAKGGKSNWDGYLSMCIVKLWTSWILFNRKICRHYAGNF